MELKGKRFLVIGGAGLIGSHTVDALLREDVGEVVVFDNLSRGRLENLAGALRDPRCRLFEAGGDLLHPELLRAAMQGIDGVFHFAALWLLHCWDYPRSAFDVNVAGTFNVLEALLDAGVKRLVYSSSASVYGDAVEEPMTEDHPFMNTTFYGATKVAGEQFARALHHRWRGTPRHFDYVGLRYMNVYGPRQDYKGAYIAVIMKMLDRLDRGEAPVIYGDGSQAYDFVYVEDCARANVCAMRAEATDRFYNVGTGIRTSIADLTRLVIAAAGVAVEPRHEPAGQTFVKNRIGCPRRAREELGFEATVALPEGLARLVDWRRAHAAEVAARRGDRPG